MLLIVKVDVDGSLEPVVKSLENLDVESLKVRVLHADVGDITENDVNLASASDAIVIGFNVTADSAAEHLAESLGVDVRTYDIIYKLIESVELALHGLLEPEYADRTYWRGRSAPRDPSAEDRQYRGLLRAGRHDPAQFQDARCAARRSARQGFVGGQPEAFRRGCARSAYRL